MLKEFLFDVCSNHFISGFEYIKGDTLIKYFQPYTDSFEKDNWDPIYLKSRALMTRK